MSPTQVKIRVPGNHLMVGLLGQRDELLRLVQDAFPGSLIVVRGNEITIDGDDAERVGRLFDELVLLLEQGHRLDASDIDRTIAMVKDDVRPSDVLTSELLRSARGTVGPSEDRRAEALHGRHRDQRRDDRDRACRNRKVLPGGRAGGAGTAGASRSTGSSSPGRRSKPVSGSGSSPATSWPRSTLTCGRFTTRSTTCSGPKARNACSSAARSRSPRSRSCAAHLEPELHNPRRGAEHEPRADEDVPHADRVRFEGRRDR